MAQYSVGIETKDKILSVCRELFYEYGINDTSYKMISEKANINRGLLPYHFKSKNIIAQIIYDEFWNSFNALIEKEFHNYSLLIKTAITEILLFRCLCNNNNFLRFYNDIKSNRHLFSFSLKKQEDFIKSITETSGQQISEEEMTTLSCMFLGVESGLVYNVFSKKIRESADKISKKDLQFVFSMLNFPLEDINAYYNEAIKLANNYSLSVNRDFTVKLETI